MTIKLKTLETLGVLGLCSPGTRGNFCRALTSRTMQELLCPSCIGHRESVHPRVRSLRGCCLTVVALWGNVRAVVSQDGGYANDLD